MGNTAYDSQIRLGSTKRNSNDSVALCFKVPFEFRQRFKLHALQRSMTMTELLVIAVESYVGPSQSEPQANLHEYRNT
jgi:hypothetical protein